MTHYLEFIEIEKTFKVEDLSITHNQMTDLVIYMLEIFVIIGQYTTITVVLYIIQYMVTTMTVYLGVCIWEPLLFKVHQKPIFMIHNVFLYAKNNSDKISDRLGTLKGRF